MTVSAELEAEIHRLSAVELWPPGTIARQLAIHIDVVHRVLGLQAPPQHVRNGSFVDDYVPFMRETLARWPTLRSTRLFDMLKVERAIRFVRERALVDFVFRDIDDGNERLQRFCTGAALDRPHLTLPGRTVRDCLDEERPRLLSLVEPLPPTEEQRSVVVDKTAFIRFDSNDYSVPHNLVGRTLTLIACDRDVRLVEVAEQVARHKRCFGRRQTVENPEHRRALVELKRRARDGIKRDQLCKGVPAFQLVLERWLEEGRNIGVAVARASNACDDYGVDVFAAAVDEFVSRGLVDPAALGALCDHIQRHRKPRATPAPAPHHVDDRDVTPHDLGGYDDPED